MMKFLHLTAIMMKLLDHDGTPGGEFTFELNASGSSDIDNDALEFDWYLDESSQDQDWIEALTLEASGESVSISKEEGSYSYVLRVTDAYGASSDAAISVIITAEDNSYPVAIARDAEYQLDHDGVDAG